MAAGEHIAPLSAWIDYDYAIVRVVPRVDLSAFVNVGVVMHSRTTGFLGGRIILDPGLIAPFVMPLDPATLCQFLSAYLAVCQGGAVAAPIGLMPPSERFHWLTAPRSAVIQTSPVHPGRCHGLIGALDLLFAEHCQAIGMQISSSESSDSGLNRES